jgi:hypothetical protein
MDADVAARTRTLGLGMERVVLWLVGGWYAPTINQYNIATVETTLFSAPSRRVVWTGVTETFEPRSVARDAPAFSDAVITALQSRGLLLVAK